MKKHNEIIYTILFVLLIILIAYVAVTTAQKHITADNAKLLMWWYNNAVRP